MLRLVFVFLLLSLFPLTPIYAQEKGVVINSFRISGESATDEYIELYNPTKVDINLLGWRLTKKTASGTQSNVLTSFPDVVIEPDKTLIIGHANCLCSPDIRYSTSASFAADNSIILYSDSGRTVADKVGFGLAEDYEGAPTKNPTDHEIYGRKDNGLDTNNNLNDFHLLYAPPKPEEKNAPEPTPVKKETSVETKKNNNTNLIVTEFLPNPKGADSKGEFIEIKNTGPRADIGGYYIADTLGSPKSYKIPEGTTIESGEYMAFFSDKTRISLNNNGDGIEVWDPEKNIINSSLDDSGKAPEEMSYALSGSDWSWTNSPTPGKPNVIVLPVESEVKGSESISQESIPKDKKDQAEGLGDVKSFVSENDRVFGIALIVVAIFAAFSYTLYANKERLIGIFNKKFGPNNKLREKIRERFRRR